MSSVSSPFPPFCIHMIHHCITWAEQCTFITVNVDEREEGRMDGEGAVNIFAFLSGANGQILHDRVR